MPLGVKQVLYESALGDGIPARHGADVPKARRIGRSLRWMISGVDPEPTSAQWLALGLALRRGDPPADDLADWMSRQGLRTALPLFERALNLGIDEVPDAPRPLKAFFQAVEDMPDWVRPPLLIEGAKASHLCGLTGLQALRDAALMGGYQASAINQTLVLTGALAQGAQRRVAETTKWWIDCTSAGGLTRFAPGFRTTVRVRAMHALVRRRVRAMPEWDEDRLGLPINQCDMQATYLGFSVVFLVGQRMLGVPLNPAEGHAVMHLWRYIGWLMGVEEDLLYETEQQGRVGLYQNLLSQAPPDDSSAALGRALMDEPLGRDYGHAWPLLNHLHGRYERAKHLSLCRFFLGRQGMSDLGLPAGVLPWYPAFSVPWTAVKHHTLRLLPGGHAWLARQGREAQEGYLAVLFGAAEHDIARLPHAQG